MPYDQGRKGVKLSPSRVVRSARHGPPHANRTAIGIHVRAKALMRPEQLDLQGRAPPYYMNPYSVCTR